MALTGDINTLYTEKRRKAMENLKALGFVFFAKDIEMFHGRAGRSGEQNWEVNPNYNNAGNNTGNSNVYNVSGLYVSTDKSVAEDFADARVSQKQGDDSQVYKITSIDDDAVIFSSSKTKIQNWLKNASEEDKALLNQSLLTLIEAPVTEDVPVPFKYRNFTSILERKLQKYTKENKRTFIPKEECERLIRGFKASDKIKSIFNNQEIDPENFITDYIAARNTKALCRSRSEGVSYMLSFFVSGSKSFETDKGENIPISQEYIMAWCERNKIIGVKTQVDSATLGKEIETINLFDLKKVVTEKKKGNMLAKAIESYGSLIGLLDSFIPNDEVYEFVAKANADELMSFIKQDEKFKKLYSLHSSSMAEGWTVGQHTQAVLDFFDQHQKHKIDERLHPFMKVCILAHDIGKGRVGSKPEYGDQKSANMAEATQLYDALGIGEEYRHLIDFVIGDSQDYTSKYYFAKETSNSYIEVKNKKKVLGDQISDKCLEILKENFRENEIGENDVTALKKMCIVLQQSDSGSYTHFAKIKGEDGQYHRGRNERFTNSFITGEDGYKRLKTYNDDMNKEKQ